MKQHSSRVAQQKMKEQKERLTDSAKSWFSEWNHRATIQPGDSTKTIVNKLLIRIGGVIAMTLFSPAIILVLILVFILAL